MIIRKTQQPSNYPSNSIYESYTESSSGVYNCNYINGLSSSFNIITGTANSGTIGATGSTSAHLGMAEENRIGNKLSVANGGIVIGKGVTKVKISANLNVQIHAALNGMMSFHIFKNGTRIDSNYIVQEAAKYYYISIPIPTYILNVQEGDILSLYMDTPVSCTLHNDMYGKTQMTVEVIG